MSIISLKSNNKNQYRRFPFKQGAHATSIEGRTLPDNIFVNCSLTTLYGKHQIYVKQIYNNGTMVKVVIASALTDDTVLGEFRGTLGADFVTLSLYPYERYVSGNITLGPLSAWYDFSGVLNFNSPTALNSTEFEESLIFCYTPPAVTSIRDKKGTELRGFVGFGTLSNLTKTTNRSTSSTNFTATYPNSVSNLADKSSYLGNCSTPAIKSINGVAPFPFVEGTSTVNDGNIYIAGVRPILFLGNENSVTVVSEDVTLDKLCSLKHNMLPPVDVTGFTLETKKDEYYNKPALSSIGTPVNYPYPIPDRLASNFNAAVLAEYNFWPQFVAEDYYASWVLVHPSAPTITSVTAASNSLVVAFTSPKNEGVAAEIINYQYSIVLATNAPDFSTWITRSDGGGITSPLTISGLVPGTKYSLKLRALTANATIGIPSHIATISTT